MTKLDSVLKSRHHFADKGLYGLSYHFSSSHVQLWELNHKDWTPKSWCFQIVVLEKTLDSPSLGKDSWESLLWIARRSNQSILKEINPGRIAAEAEAPTLWPLDGKSHLTGKTLMLGKTEGRRRRGWQRMKWWDSTTKSVDMNLSRLWEIVEDEGAHVLQSLGSQRVRHNWVTEQQWQNVF